MATHHPADARTALMAAYMTQWTSPQAGTRITHATSTPQLGGDDHKSEVFGTLAARGRTIYNAEAAYPLAGTKADDGTGKGGTLAELARIDVEEALRKHWGQFLIVARGDVEGDAKGLWSPSPSSRETTPTDAEAEMAAAAEMFERYMENN